MSTPDEVAARAADDAALAAAEALFERPTPGPWAYEDLGDKGGNAWAVGSFYDCTKEDYTPLRGRIESERYDEESGEFVRVADSDKIVCDSGMTHDDHPNIDDAAFVAAAREGWPKAVAIARRLQGEIAGLRAQLQRVLAAVREICVECSHVHPDDETRCGAALPNLNDNPETSRCLCRGWLPRRELRAAIAETALTRATATTEGAR